MPLEACSNNSTNVLLNQPQNHRIIDKNRKVTVTCFMLNKWGEILRERKCRLGPSYYKRGIYNWFWKTGMIPKEDVTIENIGHNRVIARGTY